MLCPPANQGTSSGGSSIPALSHTHTHTQTCCSPFSPAPSCRGRQEQPSPGEGSPSPMAPGYRPRLQLRRRLRSSSEERLQPLRLLPQAGRRDSKKEGAQSPAQRQTPSPGALGGARLEEFLGCVPLQSLPALLEASLGLGKLIPRVRKSQLPLQVPPLTPPIHENPDSPRAPSAPSTVASPRLCSFLLSSSIQVQALQRFQLLHQELRGKKTSLCGPGETRWPL